MLCGGKIIDRFLGQLSLENRVLFMRRYWFCDTYAEIAGRYGISERHVKKRINEIISHLSAYLDREGVSFGINHIAPKFVEEAESYIWPNKRRKVILLFRTIWERIQNRESQQNTVGNLYIEKNTVFR